MKRKNEKFHTQLLISLLAIFILVFQACGSGGNGNGGSSGGSFTLSAVAQFPGTASNINFSTSDDAISCAFVCELSLSSGGHEDLSKSFNTVLSCLGGQPLGGEVVLFDQEPVNVISFDHPFTLFLECVNLTDTLVDFLGGFGGSVTFEVKAGENVNVGKVPLLEQALVDINLCLPGAIDLAITGAVLLFCDFEQEVPEGLFGLCAAADPGSLARIVKTFLGCPFCGDGEIQSEIGEECESDNDCGEGGLCTPEGELDGCQCEFTDTGNAECGNDICETSSGENGLNCGEDCFCGDRIIDSSEECDHGDDSTLCDTGFSCIDCKCQPIGGDGDGDGDSCGNLIHDVGLGEECDYVPVGKGASDSIGCITESETCNPETCECVLLGCDNDFQCEFNENLEVCAHDCFFSCGDGICNNPLEPDLCGPSECADCNGDGSCQANEGETNDNCFDCPFPNCGNGTCDGRDGETIENCPSDCPPTR